MPKQDKDTKEKLATKRDYELLGRAMENIVAAGYFDKKRLAAYNFLRGIAFGLGSALGATLLIALTLYLLSLFSELPWVGQLFESIRSSIDQSTNVGP